jgi:hypothetical protein
VASPDLVMAGSYDYRPWADGRTNAGDGWLRSYHRDSGKRKVERCAHPNQCDDRNALKGDEARRLAGGHGRLHLETRSDE